MARIREMPHRKPLNRRHHGDGCLIRVFQAGFTVIEVLVVLGVLMILTALLLPALRKSTKAANETGALTKMRDHAQLIYAYAGQYDGYSPVYIKHPWSNAQFWDGALRQAGMIGSNEETRVKWFDDDAPLHVYMTAVLSMSHQTLREGSTPPSDQQVFVPIRLSDIASPSGKGLLYVTGGSKNLGNPWCCGEPYPCPVAFSDASAEVATWAELTPGGILRIQDNVGFPVHSTWNGVLGRDR
jgi:type II secretory pathway pseudopilin PulG